MSVPATALFETTQPDEAAEAIRRAFGYRVSLSAGELSYRQRVVPGDTIGVADVQIGTRLGVVLEPMDELMFVDVHAGTYAYNPWGRDHLVGADSAAMIPPGQAMHFDIRHSDVSTITFGLDTLRHIGRDVFDLDDPAPAEGTVSPTTADQAWFWRRAVRTYRQRVLETPGTEGGLIATEAARLLVMGTIAAYGLLREPPRHATGTAAVGRAVAFIDDNLQSPITLQDIAAAARLSERGVQVAFRRERGQTPLQYVRAGRLAGAHADLLAGGPDAGTTVAGVAAAWGFTNAGRFAKAYRDVFGHFPRHTLEH